MMIAAFLINNKDKKIRFFKKIFLFANFSLDVIFKILFFTLSNANVKFLKQKILWQGYITAKTLYITCQVEVIDWKKFAATALDKEEKSFVIHLTFIFFFNNYHKVQQVSFYTNKNLIIILPKCFKFIDIFSPKYITKLAKHTNINNYVIDLVENQLSPYKPIYNLGSVELEMLKTYNNTNLAKILFAFLNIIRVLLFYFSKKRILAFGYVSTIKA